ncbi:MAG: HAD-IIB family hydrolase [Pirellulaceae bacterium]|nr:HAD-IIB family hydrolase [Planctomycetales bacterium]
MTAELLLISDLDDTFLGDREALRRFSEFFPDMKEQLAIVYASGRFFETVKDDVRTTPLPEPLAVIGGVGSEIRSFPEGELNQNWVERISNKWSAKKVREILADEADVKLQPEKFQSDFKVSHFLRGGSQEQLDRIQAKLFDAGVNASVIYSSDRDLDFLPEGVNKGTAAAFIARELGFDQDHVIVAGNSGNDAKLFEHDFYGIVVSNAHEQLKQYADLHRVYLSPHARADGVRDGLRHWIGKLINES